MFTYYMILVPMVALMLMLMNVLLAPSNLYVDKTGPFECGFTSYQQSRAAFSVSFMTVAMLFLPFDLEMSSMLPYVMSAYYNTTYGLMMLLMFLGMLMMAFVLEVLLQVLKMDRQYLKEKTSTEYYKM
uniref:NADH-ubiquinone oxidoreductase chain 3 n=1 Tax=Candida prachuapensis TaxID=536035 RepID=U3MF44_9ASCO|nr:NADH dehydrogenase subunit 3 [Candida prachuapensis]AGW07378.1 NADH dehydrogenase subunit 3 [Candida prachuapensis]